MVTDPIMKMTEKICQILLLLPWLFLSCQNNNNFTGTMSPASFFPFHLGPERPRCLLKDLHLGQFWSAQYIWCWVLKNWAIVLTGTAVAAFLWNPDCAEVPTRKLNSSENLARKQAAPGMVFLGECRTLSRSCSMGEGIFLFRGFF